MISVKKLDKYYDALQAVKGVSFEVGQGEIVGLLGHNGAGKTTVMKIITGYLEPTSGSATVGKFNVTEDRLSVQKQIGYMPENAPLYQDMLVQEYLLMMAELRDIPLDKCQQAVLDAAKATGLLELLTRPISTLSKGYRQRVGLCQAILHKPEVLILDEPTNGLDPVQIVEIRSLIKKLAENSTVILSTHILPEIEAVCNRVIILIDGELVKDQPLQELLASSRIKLSIPESAQKVEEQLKGLSGIVDVNRVGADPSRHGFILWTLQYSDDIPPIPELIRLANGNNWDIGQVACETPSLEQIFGDLMKEYADKKMVSSKGQEVTA